MIERPQQIEVGDLPPGERVKREPPGAAAEQVGPPPLQLAGARPAEDEREPIVLYQPVDLVQQGRNPLDLVQHDGPTAGRRVQGLHAFREHPRRPGELQQEPGVKKIETRGPGKLLFEERGLPGLPRPPQERRPRPREARCASVREYMIISDCIPK